ncbi:MAG: DNA replication/repair protein RecF [Hyphomicrobiales bacterium]
MADIFPTRIRALKLTNFRNYQHLNASFETSSVVLVGPNGAGKTNLLEALSFLSPGRGLRRAQYHDVALEKAKGGNRLWAVSALIDTPHGDVDIGTGLSPNEGPNEKNRKIRIDREPAKNADAMTEYVRLLWLTPSMDGLFTGSAGDRRRFLDRLVLAVDPAHGRRVNAFDKAVRGRNRILDEAFHNTAWLDAVEIQVAELGVAITAARLETVAMLIAEIDTTQQQTDHFPQATLALEGVVDELVASQSATDAEDQYRRLLGQTRVRDRAAGRTLDGPHRADLVVRHLGKEMPARLCSTGEQKALLIGIILAHARLVAHMANMTPIILLDEVAAHLDEMRRAALFDVLESLNCQAWMTGTDHSLFEALGHRAHTFHVESGAIKPC